MVRGRSGRPPKERAPFCQRFAVCVPSPDLPLSLALPRPCTSHMLTRTLTFPALCYIFFFLFSIYTHTQMRTYIVSPSLVPSLSLSPSSPFPHSPARNPGGGHVGGSHPRPPSGLHRASRHAVKTVPFPMPNSR